MKIGAKILDFLSGGIVDRAADLVDQVIPDKDLAEKFKHELRKAQQSGELVTEQMRIEAERDVEIAVQETHQVEAQQSDIYTKRSRPKIARQSFWATTGYVTASVLSNVLPFLEPFGVEWPILTVLASPMLAYMGVRTFDKWKHPGR